MFAADCYTEVCNCIILLTISMTISQTTPYVQVEIIQWSILMSSSVSSSFPALTIPRWLLCSLN